MKKFSIYIVAFSLIVGCATEVTFAKKDKKQKHKKCCCPKPIPPAPAPLIAGTWLFNEIVNEIGSFSVLTADEKGNIIIHRSVSIQQSVPSNFQTGNYTTIDAGIWKQFSRTEFNVKSSSLVNIALTGIPQALAGTEFARAQSCLELSVSEDGTSMMYMGTITLYEADDLTFSRPLLHPVTGLPFVSHIAGSGIRYQFSLLDMGP